MSRLARNVLLIVALVCMGQLCAWCAITVTYTDAIGFKTVNLNLISNVDYVGGIDQDLLKVWSGTFPITMDDAHESITFTATGNYMDGGTKYNEVRLLQNITNSTTKNWTDFHESASGTRNFKLRALGVPVSAWTTDLLMSSIDLSASASEVGQPDGQPVNPGTTFGFNFDHKISSSTGNAACTWTEHPTYPLPEPGGAAALLSGLIGLFGFIKRRLP